jgi:hypothetical protein
MDGATSRAEPRDLPKRSRRLAGSRPRVLAAASLAIAATVFAGCSGGGDSSSSSDSSPSSTAAPAAKTNVAVPLGEVIADSAGAPAQFTPEQSQSVMKVVSDYLMLATIGPLRTAKPAGDLTAVFDGRALAAATGVDRAVLLDEGLPEVTGVLNVLGQPVRIVALADQDGGIVLATATLDVAIEGVTKVPGAPLRILRKGDLVLAPDGGGWKVTGYTLAVARTGAGLDPTTTTAAIDATPASAKGTK